MKAWCANSPPAPSSMRKRNVIFIGGTGTGKTHLCIGVASAVIRARAKGRFFNLVDLVNQLEQEKAAGRSGRLAEKLLRYDLIVIDELGYLPFSQPGGQLLFHLISKLYENTSLLMETGATKSIDRSFGTKMPLARKSWLPVPRSPLVSHVSRTGRTSGAGRAARPASLSASLLQTHGNLRTARCCGRCRWRKIMCRRHDIHLFHHGCGAVRVQCPGHHGLAIVPNLSNDWTRKVADNTLLVLALAAHQPIEASARARTSTTSMKSLMGISGPPKSFGTHRENRPASRMAPNRSEERARFLSVAVRSA